MQSEATGPKGSLFEKLGQALRKPLGAVAVIASVAAFYPAKAVAQPAIPPNATLAVESNQLPSADLIPVHNLVTAGIGLVLGLGIALWNGRHDNHRD